MARVPRIDASPDAPTPTDVRDPDVVAALAEARGRALVAESPIGIFEVDVEGRCVFLNSSFERLTGLSAHDALGDGWTTAVHPDDIEPLRAQRRAVAEGREADLCEVRIVARDGAIRWVRARWVALRRGDGGVGGYLGTLEDVTEHHLLEEQLAFDAMHDRLTGLGSRALLADELSAALARSRRSGRAVALLFIDLDGFKRVNDMLGHAAGDELLVCVAQRLKVAVRDGDLCVRVGGDEFVVCCPEMETIDPAARLAERLIDTLSEPYDVHGHEVVISASIGLATAQGEDPVSVDQLLSNADIAAYRAKRLGTGRVEVFDEDLRRRLSRGRSIARSVARLLDEPLLPLSCTPIAHLADGVIVGFHCALDWERAGLRDPDAIAQVVEEAGMARALDFALVRTVLSQLAAWERRPPNGIVPGLSIVLTRTGALSPLLPELVRDLLARTNVDPSLCWLGIPESAVAHDLDAASHVVAALDELGVGVALRDFGSVVSSLEQLRQLPAPTIMIAGPLVGALDEPPDEVRTALLSAIVKYARALGRIVVADGVRDELHASRLHELGCTFGAGAAFGPTITPEAVEAFLANR